jgi:hypothetical protein
VRTYYAKTSGARIPYEPPASAWNPLDLITAQGPPFAIDLTSNNRIGTRHTYSATNYEAGVRGALPHGGVVGEKWYLELKILSTGTPGDTQNLQFGLVDSTQLDVLTRPPLSDSSLVTNLAGNYLLAYTRTIDGVVWTSYPTPLTHPGGMGAGPFTGDVYSFAWDVGTAVTIRRNNASPLVVPFTPTVTMFPYMSAGTTNANGPDHLSTGESVLIQAGRKQQTYAPPAGYHPWG